MYGLFQAFVKLSQGVNFDNSALKRAEPKKYNTGVAKVPNTKDMKNRVDHSSISFPKVK